jgi:hypothetical protein
MRPSVDERKVRALCAELGSRASEPVRLYLTGGATAVLEGWRLSTVDVDLRLEPDSEELLRLLPELKKRLGLSIELASPPDFVPELPGWRERSIFLFAIGRLEVFHFDPYSQAFAKIERAFEQDLQDVSEMVRSGLVKPQRLRELFEQVRAHLYRYPAINADALERKVAALPRSSGKEEGG